jgi:dihydrofolate synthase/folylpolyglutamate synthase
VPLDEVEPLPVLDMDRGGLRVHHPTLGELRLGLLGRHQAANLAVALGVIEALRQAGLADPTAAAIRRGLARVRWPGRLELLAVGSGGRARPADAQRPDPRRPDVLLDGAHNVAGMRALVDALEELRPRLSGGRPTLLLGIMADKEVSAILDVLAAADAIRDARFVATAVAAPRALPAQDLATAWRAARRGAGEVLALQPVEAALDAAVAAARSDGGPLIVAGSLYLVGAVRDRLLGGAGEP